MGRILLAVACVALAVTAVALPAAADPDCRPLCLDSLESFVDDVGPDPAGCKPYCLELPAP